MSLNPTIAVCGQGLIADAVAVELGASTMRLTAEGLAESGDWDGLILATDCWDLDLEYAAHEWCHVSGARWMPVHTEVTAVVIGPVTLPSRPGCPECFRRRRRDNCPDNQALFDVQAANAPALAARPATMLSPLAASVIGTLAATEFSDGAPSSTSRSALIVRLHDLSIERHLFLPDPTCPICGGLPEDSRPSVALTSRPKQSVSQYRLWSPSEHAREISRAYVGPEAGLIHEVERSDESGLAVAQANVTLRVPGVRVPGGGRFWDYETSEAVAVLEALERYGGSNPQGARTVVRSAMADLSDPALDPRRLGMHEEALYDQMPHLYQPFTEESVCDWVWGYSVTEGHPVLVPETCAYFYTLNRPDRAFFAENTSGCALGSCLEEAILSGILEIAERDALLLTWHSRIPAPRIDLDATDDRGPAITATSIEQTTGYNVSLFDMTTEVGIPCVWAMATHPGLDDGGLQPGSDELALFCAAGSSLEPHRAALSALLELGPQLVDAIKRYPARRADAAVYLESPDEVRTIFDHAVAFGDSRASAQMDFLRNAPGPGRPLPEVGRDRAWPEHADLRDDLLELVDRYRHEGMEVIVVNQTAPEHRAVGLHCVKVLITGALPLTYGHRRRRLRNLPRLLSSAWRTGHCPAPLSEAHVNPLPHPFAA
jgi:ribosomal protein S12 methylthiotransferase accessory factor